MSLLRGREVFIRGLTVTSWVAVTDGRGGNEIAGILGFSSAHLIVPAALG